MRYDQLTFSYRRALLVLQASVVLVWIQILIRVVSYRRVYAMAKILPTSANVPTSEFKTDFQAIQWGIHTADEMTYGHASCLERAIAAEQLLTHCGLNATLQIGIERTGAEISAHAWTESNGKIVIGGGDLDSYATLESTTTDD
jgi:hypothetical protein